MVFNICGETENPVVAKDVSKQLGDRIRLLRQKQGLTQNELAQRAGISTKYLQNLEGKDPKRASIDTLQGLADGFEMPLWKFLKFED